MAKKSWTKKELAKFHKLIEIKRNDTYAAVQKSQEVLDDMMEDTGASAIYSSHMAEAGTDQSEREKANYWLQRETKYLSYLDKALGMIRDGSFGICKECSCLIGEERLKEVPHTSTCYSCKSKMS
jgi:DnaK suppressor protein